MRSFAFALAGVLLAALILPELAAARGPIENCRPRQVGTGKFSTGAEFVRLRIQPKAGTTCRMLTAGFGRLTIHAITIPQKPANGRLERVRRNEILYKAPIAGNDVFVMTWEVTNIHGRGYWHYIVDVVTR
ncbi:MAG: hypothetical protein ROR55_12110 [Devosia sp.]